MTAPSFQHPPTPPAIPGDFVSVDLPPQDGMTTAPKPSIGEVFMDSVASAVEALINVDIVEVVVDVLL